MVEFCTAPLFSKETKSCVSKIKAENFRFAFASKKIPEPLGFLCNE